MGANGSRIRMKAFPGVSDHPQFMNWSDKYDVLEYSFVLPHDMETLIDYMGGADTFESRLDLMVLTQLTTPGTRTANAS